MLQPRIFLALLVVGSLLALPVVYFRRPLLSIVFGNEFAAAAPLLLLLACCIPLDFLTSYLNNAYLAWNMERHVLKCALLAAGTDIALNLYGIPRYGAMAAAINTVVSYLVYLAALAWIGRHVAEGGTASL
jgi:O-antigen/teichoic acid export membrane protein